MLDFTGPVTLNFTILEDSLTKLFSLLERGIAIMTILDDKLTELDAEVTQLTSVVDGAKTLLKTLLDLVDQNKNAPAKLDEITAKFRAKVDDLAQAIVDNTPVGPIVPPVE